MSATSDSTQVVMPASEPTGLHESAHDHVRDPYLNLSPEEVSFRAYRLWEKSGCPHGDDQAHWFAAEEELRHEGQAPDPETRDERG